MSHKKPTPEELEAGRKQALEEFDKIDDTHETPKTIPEKKEDKPNEDKPDEKNDGKSDDGEGKKDTPKKDEGAHDDEKDKGTDKDEDKDKKTDEQDDALKKKLSASARENQKILAKNRKLNQAFEEDIPNPTDDELKAEYPTWEEMTDIEKGFAKENLINKRFRDRVAKARDAAKKIEKWDEEVNSFIENPETLIKYKELEGKQNDFIEYASQEDKNSVPFPVLVSAFLHEYQSRNKPKKGQMFETGSAGPNDRPKQKSNKISTEQARRLRETDYKKWRYYVANDLIEDDIA